MDKLKANPNFVTAVESFDPLALGLAPGRYEAALRYLFDRPPPPPLGQAWYWDDDLADFAATPIEWTRLQTALFARAGTDLAGWTDEQIGMGLNYLVNHALSHVPFTVLDTGVPRVEALRLLRALPMLWRDQLGPRLAARHAPIGSCEGDLAFVCYMWFDAWPPAWSRHDEPDWRDALWQALQAILAVPCRDVRIGALHGVGHLGRRLAGQAGVDALVTDFLRTIPATDMELRAYARAAQGGCVQ